MNSSVDFSDSQSGKGPCDRKAATIKSHMRIYVNAGHDIETASQLMTAIESSGGMAGVSMTVSGPQPTAKSATVKWEGVSFINNIEYSNDGMQVWRAYGIGCGKFLSWSNFHQASSSPLSHLNKLADTEFKLPRFFRNRQSQTKPRANNRIGFSNRERQ